MTRIKTDHGIAVVTGPMHPSRGNLDPDRTCWRRVALSDRDAANRFLPREVSVGMIQDTIRLTLFRS
jgi:hypothetical protein